MTRGKKSEVGDTRVAPNGYHYTRTDNGWKLTSRVIAERTLGRELEDDERVTFVDGDRTNLDPKNLSVRPVRRSTANKRRAIIEAKVEELMAQLEDLQ